MATVRAVRLVAAVALLAVLAFACSVPFTRPGPPPVVPSPRGWDDDGLHVAWLGHASVLIGIGGVHVLTDPAFFTRIGVDVGPVTIGPRRLVASALGPDALPPIDVVVVSHAHMDSLDRPSLRAVARAPLLVVPSRTRDVVDDLGFARVEELAWGQRVEVAGVTIEAFEVSHWGKRWPWDAWRGYNAYLFTRGETTVLFAPDTAYTEAIGRAGAARPIAAAIIGNGAYDPWIRNHASPEQVWRMFTETRARALIPIHWDTFRLGREPLGEAIARLLAAAGPDADRIVIRRIGETWSAPARASAGG